MDVVEVVVHGDGRGTRDLGNGSRTCQERNLSHPRYSGVVEVVVQLLSWEVVVHDVVEVVVHVRRGT